jgi:branched-chain amino acid transport system substrate-binding protein
MKKNRNKILLLIMLVGIMMFTIACNGSNTSAPNASDKSNEGKSNAGSSKDASKAVKIAAIAPLSGPFAQNGQDVMKGTELAVHEINENGGIKSLGGAKLELITADAGSSDPSQAASVTRRVLQQNPDLVAVIGLWGSSFTVAASTVTEQAKIPMLTQSFTDEITSRGYKYIFQLTPKSSVLGAASVDYLVEMSKKYNYNLNNIAIVADNTSASKTVAQATAKAFNGKGIKVSEEQYFQPGITDATSIATRIVNAKPDLVIIGGGVSDVSLLMKTLRGMGYKGNFFGQGGAFSLKEFQSATGEAADGTIAMNAWNWDLPYKGAKILNENYKTKYNEPFVTFDAGVNYVAVYTLKEALEKAGTADPQAVRDALSKLDIESIMTGGHISFDETGLNKNAIPILVEWIDGMPRTIYPSNIQSLAPVFNLK